MKYVALLRGIGPANPNMHGSKLKGVLEDLGFKNVMPVISSGNVVFETGQTDISAMETDMERAWPAKLGFNSATIIRSQTQLRALVDADPYKGLEHSRENYLLVTFFKKPSKPEGDYVAAKGVNALCSNIDTTASKTPDFMSKLERQYGKDITSRTWLTIHRILKKMES
ncbi:MAG TPA: DUF1697 domain-containing protein [Candidatus Saccharimonadales bacterium]|nr:DUF1697 domain-containing protein [Candidatus Saccharimonadales bacterium]